ncbi:MAG TPA: hypothetical protein VKD25_01185 [Burkholderiales bacterium]|nr:hypothetical protein [Burkholderiales bacterium]
MPRLSPAACLLTAAILLTAKTALACEVCVEDHVAATYDFQVISKAGATGRSVLFVALRGKDATAPRSKETIQRAVSAMAGVDGGSIRFSAVPPAASFAWDPKRHGSGEILRVVNAKLAKDNLSLIALRVITPTP